jgi:NADH-quinone oxidoreductase subunit G
LNEEINEEWLSDKGRFAVDGLTKRRLDRPWVRRDGKLQPATWAEAFAAIKQRVAGVPASRVGAIAGDLADVEAMVALKDLWSKIGSPHLDCRQDGAKLSGPRSSYLFNTTIQGIEQAGICLLIGTDPRWEAPLVNARLRKRYLRGGFKVMGIGPKRDLTYPVTWLGDSPVLLQGLIDGTAEHAKPLREAKNPMLIVGSGALARPDGRIILGLARTLAEASGMVAGGWNGFNVLHRAASRVGGLDIGFVPGAGGRDTAGILAGAQAGEIEIVYLLGADEIDTAALGNSFVIYQGHHGEKGAAAADVVLPGAAYTEKNATWVNTEGRVQLGRMAVFPPGEAREDWKIVRALSEIVGLKLPYDSLDQLRSRLTGEFPQFGRIDEIVPAEWAPFGETGALDSAPFAYPIENYYQTDVISRASPTMAACTEQILGISSPKTGTHG